MLEQWAWIGVHQPVTYVAWNAGEPNNPTAHGSCIAMDGQAKYQWKDVNCSEKMHFVCEHE